MNRAQPEILRLAVFAGALLAALTILIVFRAIFQPLILGLGIAYLLDPAVSWLERHRWRRSLAVACITLLTLVSVAAVLVLLLPAIVDQAQALVARFPQYAAKLAERLGPWLSRVEARYPDEAREVERRLVESVKENIPGIASIVGRNIASVFQGAVGILVFFLNLVFVPVFAFYLLVDLPRIRSSLAGLVPEPYRESVFARLREVNEAVSSFLRGQVTIALILAVINAAGLALIGVPWGLFIGVVAGLANMIPYGATIFGMLPALLVSWMEQGSLARLIAVLALFAAGQALESSLLTPKIIGKKVNLHPVWILLAVIAGGSLFGFIGMLLAVPTAAAVKVFASHWVVAYKNSALYRRTPEDSAS